MRRTYAIAVVTVILLGVCVAGLRHLTGVAREAANKSQCKGNIFLLGLALRNYHEANGGFPPAYVADANGMPLYSWRVLLAPYCDRNDFFEKYNRQAAWDDEENLRLAQDENFVYLAACPSDPYYRDPRDKDFDPKRPRITNYVAVVGPGTAFP
jgi:hypothetical protein